MFKGIDIDNLHHAYCIEGRAEDMRPKLFEFLQDKLALKIRGNADFWHGVYESFGIEEGRMLSQMQSRKAFSVGKKFFVVETETITVEAQNALLKVFEEPSQDSHFFLLIRTADSLLPTLRSRLFVISNSQNKEGNKKESKKENENKMSLERTEALEEAAQFIKMKAAERLAFIKKNSDNNKKLNDLLNNLELLLYERVSLSEDHRVQPRQATLLKNFLAVRQYAADRSANLKMIFEHIALAVLP